MSSGLTEVAVGSVIAGRYQVEDFLGRGANGIVVRARDLVLNNDCTALKLLPATIRSDPKELERFRSETYIMRQLSHPNIVRIFEFGEAADGPLFLSMEYVGGTTLADRIRAQERKGAPFNFVLDVLYQICLGMIEAHDKGIIHRDLKPENIIISDDDVVKIADFGTARMLNGKNAATNDGELVGTPFYSSPEQLCSKRVDPRTDIYSFGIIAFELATGRLPFEGETHYQVTRKHLEEELPKLSSHGESKIPLWFSEFVRKCAAKEPDMRFESFRAIRDYLIPYVTNRDGQTLKVSLLRPLWAALKSYSRDSARFFRGNWIKLIVVIIVWQFVSLLGAAWLREKYCRVYWTRVVLLAQRFTGLEFSGLKSFIDWEIHEGEAGLAEYLTWGSHNDVHVTSLLLSGVDPNGRDEQGRPLIFRAVDNLQSNILVLLLEAGADPKVVDPVTGQTPLMAAFLNRRSLNERVLMADRETVLHAAGRRDRDGNTIFNALLIYPGIDRNQTRLNIEALQSLEAKGISFEIADILGNTPLLIAAQTCRVEETEFLIRRPVNLRARNVDGDDVVSILRRCMEDPTKELTFGSGTNAEYSRLIELVKQRRKD